LSVIGLQGKVYQSLLLLTSYFATLFEQMKKDIHPQYYPEATMTCSCENSFVVGATVPELRLDICSNCHPAYSGKAKVMDTAGRLDRFKARLEKSATKQGVSKK
jgi:large subunit ribosomal protein L31